MCNFASFILTETNVFMGPTDSHTDIIEYHKLKEIHPQTKEIQILKVEISPPQSRYTLPIANWNILFDQDLIPSWFNMTIESERVRKALIFFNLANIKESYNKIEKPAWNEYDKIEKPARY